MTALVTSAWCPDEVVVLTAVLGTTDPLRDPVRAMPGWDYLAVTDHPLHSALWRPILSDSVPSPLIAARRVKILAHEVCPQADVVIWVDAAFQLQSEAHRLLDALDHSEIAALRHPFHPTLAHEAQAIIDLGYATPSAVHAQRHRYLTEGYMSTHVTTTGLLVRRMTPQVRAFNRLWWTEMERDGHYRDQMSMDYCAWKAGLTIGELEGHYRLNPYARWIKLRTGVGRRPVRLVQAPWPTPRRRVC